MVGGLVRAVALPGSAVVKLRMRKVSPPRYAAKAEYRRGKGECAVAVGCRLPFIIADANRDEVTANG